MSEMATLSIRVEEHGVTSTIRNVKELSSVMDRLNRDSERLRKEMREMARLRINPMGSSFNDIRQGKKELDLYKSTVFKIGSEAEKSANKISKLVESTNGAAKQETGEHRGIGWKPKIIPTLLEMISPKLTKLLDDLFGSFEGDIESWVPTFGNLGGPGWTAGQRNPNLTLEEIMAAPVAWVKGIDGEERYSITDQMYKDHDIAYFKAKGKLNEAELKAAADRVLIESLANADILKMSLTEAAYAEGAKQFFSLKLLPKDMKNGISASFSGIGDAIEEFNPAQLTPTIMDLVKGLNIVPVAYAATMEGANNQGNAYQEAGLNQEQNPILGTFKYLEESGASILGVVKEELTALGAGVQEIDLTPMIKPLEELREGWESIDSKPIEDMQEDVRELSIEFQGIGDAAKDSSKDIVKSSNEAKQSQEELSKAITDGTQEAVQSSIGLHHEHYQELSDLAQLDIDERLYLEEQKTEIVEDQTGEQTRLVQQAVQEQARIQESGTVSMLKSWSDMTQGWDKIETVRISVYEP